MTNTAMTVAENTLLSVKDSIQTLLPESSFNKFRQFVANAALANADLNNASYQSITKAFLDCAKTGLMPDGQEAAIVTRYDKNIGCHVAVFQPMVKGAVRIINNSPRIKSFHVKTVYEGDRFRVWSDENGDHLEFEPSFDVERVDENIKLFYASAKMDNDSVLIEVMTKAQVDKHKALAKTPYVWNKFYSEMGIKTIIHRILKRLPVDNPELVQGLEQSLDIEIEQPVKKSPFKSKAAMNRTINAIGETMLNNDMLGFKEVADEMTVEEKRYLLDYLKSPENEGFRVSIKGVEGDVGIASYDDIVEWIVTSKEQKESE